MNNKELKERKFNTKIKKKCKFCKNKFVSNDFNNKIFCSLKCFGYYNRGEKTKDIYSRCIKCNRYIAEKNWLHTHCDKCGGTKV